MMVARGNILAFAEAQLPQEWTISPVAGVKTDRLFDRWGAWVAMCRGAVSVAFDVADDSDSAQVAGWSGSWLFTEACEGDDGGGVARRVTEFYRVGGAQAIAAMAFGTSTIGRVDKVVGPGNLYVTAAKVLASSECGIDMPAGRRDCSNQ